MFNVSTVSYPNHDGVTVNDAMKGMLFIGKCISESTLMYFYVHMLIYYNLSPIRYTYKLSAEVTVSECMYHISE